METNVPSWDNIRHAGLAQRLKKLTCLMSKQLPSPLENIDSKFNRIIYWKLKEINIDFYNHVEKWKKFVQSDSSPSKVDALKELEGWTPGILQQSLNFRFCPFTN